MRSMLNNSVRYHDYVYKGSARYAESTVYSKMYVTKN